MDLFVSLAKKIFNYLTRDKTKLTRKDSLDLAVVDKGKFSPQLVGLSLSSSRNTELLFLIGGCV